jgi:hypothetical protein
LGSIVPGFGTVVGGALGAGVGLVASLNRATPHNAYQKALTAYVNAHPFTVNPEVARGFVGVTSASGFAQRAASIGMSPSAIASVMGTSPNSYSAERFDLSSVAKKFSVTADSLKTASDDQKTAADKTNTAAETLTTAGEQMSLAAQKWLVGAGAISSALSPGNIHALAVAGTKTSVARK